MQSGLLSPGLPPAGAGDHPGPRMPISPPWLSLQYVIFFTIFSSLLKGEHSAGHGFDAEQLMLVLATLGHSSRAGSCPMSSSPAAQPSHQLHPHSDGRILLGQRWRFQPYVNWQHSPRFSPQARAGLGWGAVSPGAPAKPLSALGVL